MFLSTTRYRIASGWKECLKNRFWTAGEILNFERSVLRTWDDAEGIRGVWSMFEECAEDLVLACVDAKQ